MQRRRVAKKPSPQQRYKRAVVACAAANIRVDDANREYDLACEARNAAAKELADATRLLLEHVGGKLAKPSTTR